MASKTGAKTGGRHKGTPNKLTQSARAAFQQAFDTLNAAPNGHNTLAAWAKRNPTEFYKLYARLIPVEHVGEGGTGPVATVVKHIYETISPVPVTPE